jgi:hypothetical protein
MQSASWGQQPDQGRKHCPVAQHSRGLRTWRRNTATSCRNTRISTFFDCALRASSPSQAMTCRKIRDNSTATTDDLPHDHWPAMPQVTAVDDLFGTHRSGYGRSATGTGLARWVHR